MRMKPMTVSASQVCSFRSERATTHVAPWPQPRMHPPFTHRYMGMTSLRIFFTLSTLLLTYSHGSPACDGLQAAQPAKASVFQTLLRPTHPVEVFSSLLALLSEFQKSWGGRGSRKAKSDKSL